MTEERKFAILFAPTILAAPRLIAIWTLCLLKTSNCLSR